MDVSLRARFARDMAERIAAPVAFADPVRDTDLAHLPPPVQCYLRACGVVGQPRVHSLHARMHGRIRSGPHARWMPLIAEQHTAIAPAARLFYFDASMAGLPIQGYHRYVDGAASMIVRALGVVPLVHAAGPELTRAETVTLFNDMCVLAPATLVSPAIAWTPVDGRTARARFTNAGYTIEAELSFSERGGLIDFRSGDRARTAADGTVERMPWSTPLREPRSFGSVRLASAGEARWHAPTGDYAYVELTFDEVRYNGSSR
jgi:hypothetical protein